MFSAFRIFFSSAVIWLSLFKTSFSVFRMFPDNCFLSCALAFEYCLRKRANVFSSVFLSFCKARSLVKSSFPVGDLKSDRCLYIVLSFITKAKLSLFAALVLMLFMCDNLFLASSTAFLSTHVSRILEILAKDSSFHSVMLLFSSSHLSSEGMNVYTQAFPLGWCLLVALHPMEFISSIMQQ